MPSENGGIITLRTALELNPAAARRVIVLAHGSSLTKNTIVVVYRNIPQSNTMTKILLTGGSGFIASHLLNQLLDKGHTVVTTVRSQDKVDAIKASHTNIPAGQLQVAIVADLAEKNAFEEVVKSDPPFEVVMHTASPFHFNTTDPKRDLIDPAVLGTVGLLESIKRHAPSVQKVILTSSFAAMIDGPRGRAGHTYSEKDWNPITPAEASEDPIFGYRGAKTFAERAAWAFMHEESVTFSLATICPPTVYGPVLPGTLTSLANINTSNERIRDTILGKYKDTKEISGASIWVDVRDVAAAHVLAAENDAAAGQRFFVTAGFFTNREVVEIVRREFATLRKRLPAKDVPGAEYPQGGTYGFDNSRSVEVLGLKYRGLRESVVDTVESLIAVPGFVQHEGDQ